MSSTTFILSSSNLTFAFSPSLSGANTNNQKYTLPSSETPGVSAAGVGSLPGTASETSVAKLPEERRQEGLPSYETSQDLSGNTGGVGSLPGAANESGVALLPEERQRANNADLKVCRPSPVCT